MSKESGRTDRRRTGLAHMAGAYAFPVADSDGDAFWDVTVEHLFGEIWDRPGLSLRDRRLLILGALTASAMPDVARLQCDGALAHGDLSEDELREIVIFLAHYTGWPRGAQLNSAVEGAIARHRKQLAADGGPETSAATPKES